MVSKEGQRDRAMAHWRLLDAWWRSGARTMKRDGITLVFDAKPELMHDCAGNVVGIDAYVRAFREGEELRIDPHRRFYNPPLMHDGQENPLAAYRAMLFDSIRDTPHPTGWRTKGTVDTFFASTADGYVQSSNGTYATARAGGSLAASAASSVLQVGQTFVSPDYYCLQGFISFDTSSIDDAATVTAVELALSGASDLSATDFVVQARLHDWGAGLTTADWVAGGDLSGKTLLATWSSAGYTADYNIFTSEAAFVTNVNKTGTTYMLLCSKEQADNSAPGGDELVNFNAAETSGTTQDPKLTVTYISNLVMAPPAAAATAAGVAASAAAVRISQVGGVVAAANGAGTAGTVSSVATAEPDGEVAGAAGDVLAAVAEADGDVLVVGQAATADAVEIEAIVATQRFTVVGGDVADASADGLISTAIIERIAGLAAGVATATATAATGVAAAIEVLIAPARVGVARTFRVAKGVAWRGRRGGGVGRL